MKHSVDHKLLFTGSELGVMCRGGALLTTRAGNYFCNPLAAGAEDDSASAFCTLGKNLQRITVFQSKWRVECTRLPATKIICSAFLCQTSALLSANSYSENLSRLFEIFRL